MSESLETKMKQDPVTQIILQETAVVVVVFLASPHSCATQPVPSKASSPANRKQNQERPLTLNTLLSNKTVAQGKTNYRHTRLHTSIEGSIQSLLFSLNTWIFSKAVFMHCNI